MILAPRTCDHVCVLITIPLKTFSDEDEDVRAECIKGMIPP
jgi:hypothetical protein